MKRYLLTFILLSTLVLCALAQDKPDLQGGAPSLQKQLDNANSQLKKERAALRAANDSIQILSALVYELEDELIDAEAELKATKDELKATIAHMAVTNSQGGGVSSEQYQTLLKKVEKAEDEKKAAETKLQDTKKELEKKESALKDAEVKNKKLLGDLEVTSRTFPFAVTDIKFKNTRDKKGKKVNDYGEDLLKVNWLTTKIYYNSIISEGKNIELYIKIYLPKNNQLWINSNVSSDYTIRVNPYIKTGDGLYIINEWDRYGTNMLPKGNLKKGKYRMEVWHKDVCLGQKHFVIKK